eukprot:jgi/Botrbrau1/3131/Bobra.0070s0103.1
MSGPFWGTGKGRRYWVWPYTGPPAGQSRRDPPAVWDTTLNTLSVSGFTQVANLSARFLFGNASQLSGLTNSQFPTTIGVVGNITSEPTISADDQRAHGNA